MERNGNSVNFYGSFKPEEFHPAVLLLHDIEDRKFANDVSIHHTGEFSTNFTICSTNYFMDQNRFQISGKDKISKLINKKIKKIFSVFSTDILVSGHNFMSFEHNELDGIEQWKKINKRFAPLNPLEKYGNQISDVNPLSLDGLSTLKFSASEVLDSFTIDKLATIERSAKITNTVGILVCLDFLYRYGLNHPLNKSIVFAIEEEKKFALESKNIFEAIKKAY